MNENKLKKLFAYVTLGFIGFVVLFYFLAGEQLTSKDSLGNIGIVEANAVTEEITSDVTIEQKFVSKMDMIEKLSLVFTKHYRAAQGNVFVRLMEDGVTVYYKRISADTIAEQQVYTLELERPIVDARGKEYTLSITGDATKDNGVSVMMLKDASLESYVKTNSIATKATLCFGLNGRDYIPLARYYFVIMGVITLMLIAVLVKSYRDYQNNRANVIIAGLLAIEKYYFLISQLVARDFKSKYKRSVLGILWSFLNPLLTMTVQFLVFSTIFRADTQSYPVYLLTGVICFNFFRETTEMCLQSISGNARLINKVYIPKYIFPLARTVSSSINLGISLIPLFLVTLIMGIALKPAALLIFYFLGCLIIFAMGIGMFLAALMVFFRDIQFLWSVLIQIWMYATPIFYTAEIIPEKYKFIVRLNPLYHFLGNARKCLMEGISPEPVAYVYCLAFALISILVGSYVFKRTQDQFTLYL